MRASPGPAFTASAVLAATLPALLAYNLPPSATLLNQCLAVLLWGVFIAVAAPRLPREAWGRAWPALAALALMALAVLASGVFGSLPASLTVAALGLLAGATLLCLVGAALALHDEGATAWTPTLVGLALAGFLSALVALVQVFWPDLADGDLIARSGLAGRAVGNLRQPNHLSSLLCWALVAVVALLDLQRVQRLTATALYLLLVGAVVLSGSRTGAVSMLVLAAWGLADRRLARLPRALLLAAPLAYAALWGAEALWAQLTQHAASVELGAGTQRGDISSSRFGIWANTFALIARHPLTGVGFGEFNAAWTLTPFPGRPTALFDHTHNLSLQLAVELGLPLALLISGLLLWALVRAARGSFARADDTGRGARAAFMIVALAALHSQLEYPLWYAYFLLPAALTLGYALGAGSAPAQAQGRAGPAPTVALAGAVMAVGGAAAVSDYLSVVAVFAPPAQAGPLDERIARGQRSVLFAHHADYAAVTTGLPATPEAQALGWRRAPHQLIDARLMIAWARAFAEAGDVERARHIAARLREFRKAEADEFFAPCRETDPTAFQCAAPTQAFSWRELLVPPVR